MAITEFGKENLDKELRRRWDNYIKSSLFRIACGMSEKQYRKYWSASDINSQEVEERVKKKC